MTGKTSLLASLLTLTITTAGAGTVDDLLAGYSAGGAGPFDAARGQALWRQAHSARDGVPRSCAGCHGQDPREGGSHVTTGKAIAPMAPSVNPERLLNRRKIEKWFTRNCKWTLGRECSGREKGDLLVFLRDS